MWNLRFIASIDAVPAAQWNRIAATDYPFVRHEFLQALEHSGATTAATGWQVAHAVVYRHGVPVAFMPLYRKGHSYGEYVFDHAWAGAYHRHGMEYYPKLVAAIPFTPVTGARLCVADGVNEATVLRHLVDGIGTLLDEGGGSSWHVLFPQEALAESLVDSGLLLRRGVQFHWHNRGYRDFDDFLERFSSRKRKAVRRERARVAEQGLTLTTYSGAEITSEHWDHFFTFYQLTYAKRSGHGGYLNRSFFERIGTVMADQLVLVMARHDGREVGGALSLRDQHNLYGRYWGCTREFDNLHFEACYYRGIEYCIEHGLSRFDSGAQGEHKIQRGFEPCDTWSCHWIAHPGFRQAIERFLVEDGAEVERYRQAARELLPFKR